MEFIMDNTAPENRYLYWFKEEEFSASRDFLVKEGYKLTSTLLTPCQVLKSRGRDIIFAPRRSGAEFVSDKDLGTANPSKKGTTW